jgi:hypothetical protein
MTIEIFKNRYFTFSLTVLILFVSFLYIRYTALTSETISLSQPNEIEVPIDLAQLTLQNNEDAPSDIPTDVGNLQAFIDILDEMKDALIAFKDSFSNFSFM